LTRNNKVTLCGMVVALSAVLMLLTGVFPMMDFALPAMAGVLLIAVVVELGRNWAMLCWLAVSLLSFFIAPLKDSALFYFVLLGIYPIIKSMIESLRKPVLEWVLKFAFLNLTAGIGLAAVIWLFQMEAYSGILTAVPLVFAGGFLLLNVIFLVYDIALSRLVNAYIGFFRPRYISKILK